MPTSIQSNLSFPSKLNEPFHPALAQLDSGKALPDVQLTQSAKRLYARFLRQHLAAASKGRQTFRARIATLATDLELSERTIHRALDQLKAANLLQWMRTGRSSYYRLLPLPETVDNSTPQVNQCQIRSDTTADPHKKAFKETKHYGTNHVDNPLSPDLKTHIERRLTDIGFKLYQKGVKGPVTIDLIIDHYGLSWLLSWLDKAEDARADLRNPGAWLKKRLDSSRKRQHYLE